MSKRQVKPRFYLLRLDETEFWTEEVVRRAKPIFGLYVFDRNRRVYCCEFASSYECRFIGSAFENTDLDDGAAEKLADDIREGDLGTEPVTYFHCREIDALPRIGEHDLKVGITDLRINNADEAVEYVQQRVL
jgi:hypothetical protein